MQKQSFGERVNNWLDEPEGQTFRQGKWRFWFPALIGLTALNAVMTALIFGADGMQKYIGAIVVMAGAVLCWLALGLLHYSDSEDRKLAIGVAILDSITLLFVALHFSFLLWCQGHLWTLRGAEEKYKQDLATYNAQWIPVKDSNERITASVERIAQIEKETERLRNDTAYWSRRNKTQSSKSGIEFKAAVTPMEVPSPPKAPSESSAGFLSAWDWWIRVAGFGELGLSIITLIFVRTRSATRNRITEEFPDEIDEINIEERQTPKRPRLEKTTTHVSSKSTTTRLPQKNDTEGLNILRETLKLIAFEHPPMHFKTDIKDDCVWIRSMTSDHGVQRTATAVKAKLSILDDAVKLSREAFRGRLEKFLREHDFNV